MKMLKHLFGKRDKELDVLQEEALQSPLRTVVRNFTSNRLAFGGLIVFLVIFLIVLIGPVFNPIDLSEKEETQINVAPGLNMMKVPDGLKGNEIPMCAQVVGIVDAYDALINERPYKRKYESEEAIQMISNGECGAFSNQLMQCFQEAAKQQNWLKRQN